MPGIDHSREGNVFELLIGVNTVFNSRLIGRIKVVIDVPVIIDYEDVLHSAGTFGEHRVVAP
jgi:hypothetical protein